MPKGWGLQGHNFPKLKPVSGFKAMDKNSPKNKSMILEQEKSAKDFSFFQKSVCDEQLFVIIKATVIASKGDSERNQYH